MNVLKQNVEKVLTHKFKTKRYKLSKHQKLNSWLVGWLVGFYGISTFVGQSTPNSVYIYIQKKKQKTTTKKLKSKLKATLFLMTTKSMVESAWAKDKGHFLYHLQSDTRKITRSFEK